MNRRERRKIEKDLGIIKFKQKLNYKEKLKSIHEGISSGKNKIIEAKEKRKRVENENSDKLASTEMSSLATTLMLRDNLSWHEATEAAKKEIKKVKESE